MQGMLLPGASQIADHSTAVSLLHMHLVIFRSLLLY